MDIRQMLKRMKKGQESMKGSIPKDQYKRLNILIRMLDDFVRGRIQITRWGWKELNEMAPLFKKEDPELSAILASLK